MKKWVVAVCLFLLVTVGVVDVQAAIKVETIPVTYVNDISVYSLYTPSNMSYAKFNVTQAEKYYMFHMDKASIVMLNVNNYDVKLGTYQNNKLTSMSQTSLTFTLAMDSSKVNKVKEFQNIRSDFYGGPIYLEAGDYYLFVTCPDLVNRQVSINNNAFVSGSFRVGVLAQRGNSLESIGVSSFTTPNSLANGNEFRTFLSDVAPDDWWRFTANKRAMYDFSFLRLSGKGVIKAQLLDSSGMPIKDVRIDPSYSESSMSEYLDAGVYYLRFTPQDTNGGVGGDITCKFNSTVYSFTSRQDETEKTNQDVKVTIEPNFTVQRLYLIPKKSVPTMDIDIASDKNTWEKQISSGSDTVTVQKNGYYWLVACDKDNNVAWRSLTVRNIDKKAPKKPTVKKPVVGKKYVQGKGEKGATVYVELSYDSSGNWVTKKYKGVVDEETGKFVVTTRKIKKNMTVKVYVMDAAKNQSESVTFNMVQQQ